MSLWNRRKPEHVTVDLAGLGRLIRDLDGMWVSDISHGPTLRVRPHNYEADLFVVTIDPHYLPKLYEKVRSYEFSDVYGPGSGGRTDGS